MYWKLHFLVFDFDNDILYLQLKDGFPFEMDVLYVVSLKANIDPSEQDEVAQLLLENF